jgi:hypothetical protein
MANNKDDVYKELLDKMRPDIAALCDGLKAVLSADPVPEERKGLRDAARENFRRPGFSFDELSGSMQAPGLTAKQQLELLTIMVAAANRVGIEVNFLNSQEMEAKVTTSGPNVTPFRK